MKLILALMFMILNLNSYAQAEYSNNELMNMTLQSLSADHANDTAYSLGTGRIIWGSPNAIQLARRAALTDARRGLLILKRELKEGRPGTMFDVSGHVPPVNILLEEESGDIYIVRVEAVLSELMNDDKSEDVNDVYAEEEYEEEYEEYNEDNEDSENFPDVDSILSRYGVDTVKRRDSSEGKIIRQ